MKQAAILLEQKGENVLIPKLVKHHIIPINIAINGETFRIHRLTTEFVLKAPKNILGIQSHCDMMIMGSNHALIMVVTILRR